MNTTTTVPVSGDGPGHLLLTLDKDRTLGPAFRPWFMLQSRPGQEKIIRFGQYVEEFGPRIREQDGHEHRASVSFLFTYAMMKLRKHVALDEGLLLRCINHHDEPEGIIGKDVIAPTKTDKDDLEEYLAFESIYSELGDDVWPELQRAFLLQFCLTNPACFPDDARTIMGALAKEKRNEALFFDGVQRIDYLYYAYECHLRGVHKILHGVAVRQVEKLDRIAQELPGFQKELWTARVSLFFKTATKLPA